MPEGLASAPVCSFQNVFAVARGSCDHRPRQISTPYRPPFRRVKSYALEAAAARGQAQVVRYMVDNRRKIRVQADQFGWALSAASEFGFVCVVLVFLSVVRVLRLFFRVAFVR